MTTEEQQRLDAIKATWVERYRTVLEDVTPYHSLVTNAVVDAFTDINFLLGLVGRLGPLQAYADQAVADQTLCSEDWCTDNAEREVYFDTPVLGSYCMPLCEQHAPRFLAWMKAHGVKAYMHPRQEGD